MHTKYSEDATTSLREVVGYARKKGLDGVAVTDHNTIEGALQLSKQKGLIIIPGVEVGTIHGHVAALGLQTPIPPKLDLTDTVERIHAAGGIAIVTHPTAVLKTGLGNRIPSNSNLDAVEVINSASFPFFLSTYLNRRLAVRLGLPQTGGSDAHHASEIGTAYTIVDADSDSDDIVEAIRKGMVTPFGKPLAWDERFGRGVLTLERQLRDALLL